MKFVLYYNQWCGGPRQLVDSLPSANVVSNVRRPGWTPKFSQFIQDNLAVKSARKKIMFLK
jgi:hypothetical protein